MCGASLSTSSDWIRLATACRVFDGEVPGARNGGSSSQTAATRPQRQLLPPCRAAATSASEATAYISNTSHLVGWILTCNETHLSL